jgi:hypothetical protein
MKKSPSITGLPMQCPDIKMTNNNANAGDERGKKIAGLKSLVGMDEVAGAESHQYAFCLHKQSELE